MKTISLLVAAALIGPAAILPATAQEASGSLEAAPAAAPVADPVKKDPAVVAEKVTEALKQAEGVPAQDIAVSSHAGTIVLTGEVNSETEIVRATEAAESASDGSRVNSSLEVRAPEDRPMPLQPNASMVQAVEHALRSDKRTSNLGVTVTSEKAGVVTLHGLMASADDRNAAYGVAAKTPGVKQVESRMVIPGS